MRDDRSEAPAQLDAGELRALSEQGIIKTFPKNTVIVNEGDETNSFYIIVAGRVKIFVSDDTGKEIVLGTYGEGDYFGEMVLDGGPRSASVMTLEPSRFAVVPKEKFREFLLTHPNFTMHFVERLIRRTRTLTENVKSLALMDVYGRVARMLLELAKPADGRLVIEERLTQQDIADRVGASREMISRILKELTIGGYITIDKKHITINKTPPQHW